MPLEEFLPEPCVLEVVGLPGPRGRRGPPGESGDGAGFYLHTQSTPSSSWLIPHNLGREIVGALVYSADYSVQYGGVVVEPLNENECRLWLSPPVAGVARIY